MQHTTCCSFFLQYKLCLYLWKLCNGRLPIFNQIFFPLNDVRYNQRCDEYYYDKKFQSSIMEKSIFRLACRSYNDAKKQTAILHQTTLSGAKNMLKNVFCERFKNNNTVSAFRHLCWKDFQFR